MFTKKQYSLGLAIAFAAFAFSSDAAAAVLVTTYDNISALSTALTRAALIFSDNSFTSTAYAFGYAGLAVGAIGTLTAMGQGRPINPIAFVVPFILGAVIMAAIIVPKEDITVQDRVTNEIETVYAFPAPLANVLSWLTEARDAVIDLIDTSAPPGPPTIWLYRYNTNGVAFDILMRALSKAGSLPDQYLNASVDKYIDDCIPIALSNGNINWNSLNNNNVEFMTLLAAANHPSWPSGYFTDANPGGVWGTCRDSWNYLQPRLSGISAQQEFKNMILGACGEHGMLSTLRDATFSTNAIAADQRCQDLFAASVAAAEASTPPWGTSGANAWHWMRQLYLGSRIYDWASSATPNGLANYYQILDRIGAAGQAAQWMPTVRAAMFGLAIAMVPFSFLFLLTGAGSRALLYPLGTLIFVLVWEIMDAFLHVFMMEQAFRTVTFAGQHGIGLVGLAMLGDTTTKMMTSFAGIRVMSATLAVSFMYVVFRFGGMAMATMASSFAASSQAAGADAMRKTTDPVQHGEWLRALSQSDGTQFAAHGVGGYHNYAEAARYGSASQAQTNYRTASSLGGAGSAANRTAAVNSGANVGKTVGTERASAEMGMSPTQAAAMAAAGQAAATTAKGIGTEEAMNQAAKAGINPTGGIAENTNYTTSGDISAGDQMLKDLGSSPANVSDEGRSVGAFQNISQRAANHMARAAAHFTGQSLGDSLRNKAGVSTRSMSPAQMQSFLAANRDLANNLSEGARSRLEQYGGTLSMAISSDNNGQMQITSMSLRNNQNGGVDWSSSVDNSTNMKSGVTSTAGIQTSSPLAAQQAKVEGLRTLHDELQSALEAGDEGRIMAVGLVAAQYTGELLGAKSQASASEQGVDGKSIGVQGRISGGVKLGGKGKGKGDQSEGEQSEGEQQGGAITQAIQDLAGSGGLVGAIASKLGVKGGIELSGSMDAKNQDLRTDKSDVSVGGYYDTMARWAAQAKADYAEAMAKPNATERTGKAAVNGEFLDMMKAAEDYWTPKVEQAADASAEQGAQLNQGSGVSDRMAEFGKTIEQAMKKYW